MASTSPADNRRQLQPDLVLPHGRVRLPAFLPDATMGVVRAVDATDLLQCRIQAVVMNTYHLMLRPGSSTVQSLGGLHAMAQWPLPIVTDSGGFQVYSLIHQNAKFGHLTDEGAVFKPDGASRKFQLTPEKTIQLQLRYGTDLAICLDDCTHVDAPFDAQRDSVRRTILWARRCKQEFDRQIRQRERAGKERPLLFAVIQGGGSRELRARCASELLEIGFDGFGYGGWPLDDDGHLLTDMLSYTRELVPAEFPMHALGVGHPNHVVSCAQMGYGLFDSALPTRDARRGRLYALATPVRSPNDLHGNWLSFIYAQDAKHIKAKRPISSYCDCLCCTHYSLGYLHHLFKLGDSLFYRLASIHNLRFMARLTAILGHRGDE